MARGSGGDALRGISSGRTEVRAVARDVALPLVLGVIAIAVVRLVRTPVELPGHQGAIWMAALVAARLASRAPVGGSIAGIGAFAASMVPVADPSQGIGILVAGVVLDAASALRGPAGTLLWSIVAGAVGNAVVLMAKLALGDLPRAVLKQGIGFGLETYLAFGALGGFVVGAVAFAASRRGRTDRT